MYKIITTFLILFFWHVSGAQTTNFGKISSNNTGIYSSDVKSVFFNKDGSKYFVHQGVISILRKNNNWDYIINSNIGGTKGIMDSDGNIWLVGFGLTKISGKTVLNYSTSNSGIKSNTVNSVCQDKDGSIIIGSDGGVIQKFDGKSWTDINYINTGQANRNITDIKLDKSGNKWVGTNGFGILLYNDTGYRIFNTLNSNIVTNNIYAIAIDSNEVKWISTDKKGIIKYDNITWTITTSGIYNDPILNQKITCLKIDFKNRLWIGYNKNGLHRFGLSYWFEPPLGTDGTINNWNIPSYNINDITFDSNGSILIGTEIGSAINYDVDNNHPWNYYDNSNTGLSMGQVLTFSKDKNKNIWVGLGSMSPYDNQKGLGKPGISIYQGNNWLNFNNYNSPIGKPLTKNSNSFVQFIFIDSDENKWMPGTNSIIKLRDSIWTEYTPSNAKYTYGMANCFGQDKNKVFWIGTENGLVEFNGDSVVRAYNMLNSNIPSNKITCLYIDKDNNKWLGGNDGLVKFDGNTFVAFNTNNSNIKSNAIFKIANDPLGNIWITTQGAIQKFNGTNFSQILPNRFNNNFIETLYFDSAGIKWFSYSNGAGDDCGIGKIKDTTITVYNYANSNLPKDLRIVTINEDNNGKIWFGHRSVSNSCIYTLERNTSTTGNSKFEFDYHFVAYPNPVKDRLYFEENGNFRYEIININGQPILNGLYDHGIDVSGLSKGFYLIVITRNNLKSITRFIKD